MFPAISGYLYTVELINFSADEHLQTIDHRRLSFRHNWDRILYMIWVNVSQCLSQRRYCEKRFILGKPMFLDFDKFINSNEVYFYRTLMIPWFSKSWYHYCIGNLIFTNLRTHDYVFCEKSTKIGKHEFKLFHSIPFFVVKSRPFVVKSRPFIVKSRPFVVHQVCNISNTTVLKCRAETLLVLPL
jgi:hypothetical protein